MDYKEAYWKPAAGGAALFYRSWYPDYTPHSALLLLHGYGEHGGRYRELAGRFSRLGCIVFVPDLPGHGHSEGKRAYLPKLERMIEELHGFIGETVRSVTELPLLLMGHSMGGGLATLYALEHQEQLEGLILSGAAIRLGGSASLPQRLAARLLAAVLPGLPLAPFDLAGISRDPEVVEEYAADPLVYTGRVRVYSGLQLLRIEELTSPGRLARLRLPMLIYHGGADRIVPPEASSLLYQNVSSPDTTYRVFPDAYHEVHNEAEKDALFELIEGWIRSHRGG
jgi:alpha-beta hydrolase superfamily lysophospholipase